MVHIPGYWTNSANPSTIPYDIKLSCNASMLSRQPYFDKPPYQITPSENQAKHRERKTPESRKWRNFATWWNQILFDPIVRRYAKFTINKEGEKMANYKTEWREFERYLLLARLPKNKHLSIPSREFIFFLFVIILFFVFFTNSILDFIDKKFTSWNMYRSASARLTNVALLAEKGELLLLASSKRIVVGSRHACQFGDLRWG